MSEGFQKVLVVDSRITPQENIEYAVYKGGQNVTYQPYQAISVSNSQASWNIQVPSQETLVSRRALLRATFKIAVSVTGTSAAPSAEKAVAVLKNGFFSLNDFPLHQAMKTAQATINNNTVSVNMQDVLPFMLRLHDKRELSKYNGMTANYRNGYFEYADAYGANNNPLGGFNDSADNDLMPRGSFPFNSYADGGAVGSVRTVIFEYTCTEPLMLSPFTFLQKYDSCGSIYGITNMNIVLNLDSSAFNRMTCLSSAIEGVNLGAGNDVAAASVVSSDFASSNDMKFLLNFVSAHPSQMLPPRNVVPYYDMPRYINTTTLGDSGATKVLQSQSLQLNQVPDMLIIGVRDVQSARTAGVPDRWYPISASSFNWNNNSGILSSASQQDLYSMSEDNCLNMNWLEFQGKGLLNNNAALASNVLKTCGGFLVLAFGKDIQLVEDFYAQGSIGNFNLQYQVTVLNNSADNGRACELVTIPVNSGLFVTEKGVSQTYTGILTKQDVLDASRQEPVSENEARRLIGGGWFARLKSALPAIARVSKVLLKATGNPYANTAADVIGALGYGRTGGGTSGGMSGHLA